MDRARSSAKEAQGLAVRLVRRYLPDPTYRIFLFGSRAKGTARVASDIDIGIEGPSPVPYETLAVIRDALDDAPTLYTIDVVDFRRLPEKFREIARERVYLDAAAV
jgi:predicted nucleotidyltransferase